MIYQWRPGFRVSGDSQVVGEKLEELRVRSGGMLSPKGVVVEAQDERHVLHRHFEWRDSVAAQRYRESQASDLIRSVVAIHEDAPDVELPAFVSVGPSGGEFGPYQAVRVALANDENRDYVLKRALSELKSWRKKYHDLKELAAAVTTVDTVIETIAHEMQSAA